MSREGALWIGGLEPYMDEEFLKGALSMMGEENVISIKVIKNKFTGEPASYGFINFDSDPAALMAMHKLNGKIIPNSTPPVIFQLSHVSAKGKLGQEHSVWISDLTSDITEKQLERSFATRFDSLKAVKIVEDAKGKVYGFVRFNNQNDQREALIHMNGFRGLGERPIKVSIAVPKPGLREANSIDTDAAQQGYYAQAAGKGPAVLVSSQAPVYEYELSDEEAEGDEEKLVEHDRAVNVDQMNNEFIARSQEVWDKVEKDRWIYDLDQEEGFVPNFNKGKK